MGGTHRIAIAGIGAVAEKHAAAIAELDDASVVAGSCRTEEKGRQFATAHDASWWAETRSMLDDVQPDVLIICTPSGAHLAPALAACERGVDILCEKPLEITTARIDRMISAAASASVTLGGVFQQRFNDVLTEVADAAQSGRFGSLAVGNAYVPWWRDDAYYQGAWQGTADLDGGGALMNQSIHAIDAIQWLVGEGMEASADRNPVGEVFAYTDRRCHAADIMEVEDTAVATLRFRDGTLGQVLGSTAMYPGTRRRLQLAGRDGSVEVQEDQLTTWSFREETDADDRIRDRFGETGTTGGAADPMAIDHELHRRNIAAFLEARVGERSNPVPATEARKAVAIIEAIYDSAQRGEPVPITT